MNRKYCPYCMTPLENEGACPNCGLTSGTYTPLPHHIPPGTVLMDRYLIGRVLGEGGFGITYIGCDLRLELKVAIKEYFPTNWVARHSQTSLSVSSYVGAAGSYEKGKSRFLYEARTMAKMDKQPEIVSVRDFFELNNTAYIVMEYVDGTTFKELVAQRGGRIPAGELLHLMEPLFYALSAVHAAGLIHRDISPDNLMLERGGIRLLDFGCARESTQGTETMTITLKHGYAPIEQYQHKGQGPWTDVYGLSATIYYCLTGKAPPQALDRLMDDEIILPRRLGVDLTENQERALLRGMGIKQHQRFRSIEEFHAALYEGADTFPAEQPEKPEEEKKPEKEAPSGEKPAQEGGAQAKSPEGKGGAGKGRAVLGIVLALIAAAGILGLILMPQESAPPAQTPPIETEWTGPSQDEIFAGAAVAEDEESLLALLADENCTAVVLSGRVWFGGDLPELRKPLLVAEGASITINQHITLGEGGLLWVEGYAESIFTIEEGQVVLSGDGVIVGSLLQLNSGGLVQLGGTLNCSCYCLEEDTIFEEAVSVSTSKALEVACRDTNVKAIRIDGSVCVTEMLDVNVPLLVSEGSRLYSQGEDGKLNVFSSAVVNYGSLDCSFWFDNVDNILLNRGTCSTAGGLWFSGPGGNGCAVLNFGNMSFRDYNAIWADFYNFNTVSVEHVNEYDMLGINFACFYNCGRLDINEGAEAQFASKFVNTGDVACAGTLRNTGSIYSNCGNLTVKPSGFMENTGVVDFYDGRDITIEDGGELRNVDGVLMIRTNYGTLSGNVNGKVWQVDYTPVDSMEHVYVTTEEELIAALADENTVCVQIDGQLNVSGDLRVTRPCYVYGGSLVLPEGATLTVDGTIFVVNGSLSCDAMELKNGAMAEVIGWWNADSEGASLTADGGSWFYSRYNELNVRDISLTGGSLAVYDSACSDKLRSVSAVQDSSLVLCSAASSSELSITADDSLILQFAQFDLDGSSKLELSNGSIYWVEGVLNMNGGSISTRSGAFLNVNNGGFTLGSDASFTNNGFFMTMNYSDLVPIRIRGELINNNAVFISHMLEVSGRFVNNGQIYSAYDPLEDAVRCVNGAKIEGSSLISPYPDN